MVDLVRDGYIGRRNAARNAADVHTTGTVRIYTMVLPRKFSMGQHSSTVGRHPNHYLWTLGKCLAYNMDVRSIYIQTAPHTFPSSFPFRP